MVQEQKADSLTEFVMFILSCEECEVLELLFKNASDWHCKEGEIDNNIYEHRHQLAKDAILKLAKELI